MKIYISLEAPFEWVRIKGQKVDAFGEVASPEEYPLGDEEVEVIGVVPGEWVTTHQVLLPAKTRKQFSAALPYALEESISEDVENMHFVFPVWKPGESCNVSVVARSKMLEWQAVANEHRIPIQQLIPDHVLVPFHDAAECSVALSEEQILAHHQDGYGVNLDESLLEVWLMDVPINSTIAVNDEALTESLIRDYPDRDFRHWPFGSKMAHWLEYQTDTALDLWGDQYKPKVTKISKQTFLLPAAMILLALGLKVGYDTFRYLSLHNEIANINTESQSILKETFPTLDKVQTGQERDVMEKALSRLGGPDRSKSMHSALAEVSRVALRQRVSLSNIVYRNNELVITCLLNNFSQVDTLTKQFNERSSLDASLQSSSSEDGQVIASYSIKQNDNVPSAADLQDPIIEEPIAAAPVRTEPRPSRPAANVVREPQPVIEQVENVVEEEDDEYTENLEDPSLYRDADGRPTIDVGR